MRSGTFFPIFLALAMAVCSGCQTKSDLKRQQELEKLRADVREAKGEHADDEVANEEVKEEMGRLGNAVEERSQKQQQQLDDMKKELTALTARVQALEQRAVSEDLAVTKAADEAKKASYETGKAAFDDGKYEDAARILRAVLDKHPKGDEAKKSHFVLAESLFASKDFASAALEFSDFQKNYPKDPLVPTAIYRQANAFRNMGKSKEAKLFYQELIERYPKSSLAAKARQERKRLK